MTGREKIEVLKDEVLPNVMSDVRQQEAVIMGINSIMTVEKIRDLIFKYRCSAVAMKNQKTYFTEHDIGYCEGALQVFEEVEKDIEGILKRYKVL